MKPLIFNSGKQYLTEAQQEIIEDFCLTPREIGTGFEKDGKLYILRKIEYPKGAITPETVRLQTDIDGTYFYRTPLAFGDDKNGRIWCSIMVPGKEEEMVIVSIKQWLNIIEGAKVVPPAAPDSKPVDETMLTVLKKQYESGHFKGGEEWLKKEKAKPSPAPVNAAETESAETEPPEQPRRKRGRPKGSKNKTD